MRWLIMAALFLPVSGNTAVGSGYAVVVSSESAIADMAPDKIRDIFLKRRNFEGGTRLIPVNLVGEDEPRREFEAAVLGMDREAINRYWISNHFQGVSPPTTQASLQSVKSFVENVDGAIGYVPLDMVDGNLRVVYEF